MSLIDTSFRNASALRVWFSVTPRSTATHRRLRLRHVKTDELFLLHDRLHIPGSPALRPPYASKISRSARTFAPLTRSAARSPHLSLGCEAKL